MSAPKKPVAVLLGVFVTLVAGLMFATSSQAYPAATPATGSASASAPSVGGTLTVTGRNFQPGEAVRVTLRGTSLGTFTADSSGDFTASVQLTNGVDGEQDIMLTGLSSGNVVTIAVDIGGSSGSTGGSGGGSGELSGTGVAVIGIAALGLVLLAGGGVLMTAGRRRKFSA